MRTVLFLLVFIAGDSAAQVPVTKLRINPDFARGGSISQYFEEVEFIPLETTKASLFGDIYKLEITSDNFIISDFDTKSVLIFDKQGKYSAKINAGKINAGFAGSADGFECNMTFDPFNNLIVVTPPFNFKKSFWFDVKGNFVKSTLFDEGGVRSTACAGTNTILYSKFISPDKKDSIKYRVVAVKDTVVSGKYLQVNANKQSSSGGWSTWNRFGYLYNSHNDKVLFPEDKFNKIYEFDTTGLIHEYDIIFPKDYIYPDSYDSLSETGKAEYMTAHNKTIVHIRSVYEFKNYLFFEVLNGGGYISFNRHFMYNLQNGDLISLDHISSDSLSRFLPFHSMFGTIAGTDGKYIYCYVPSVEMFSAKEENKHPVKYGPVLDKYFKTESRLSNPVLVRLKLKQ